MGRKEEGRSGEEGGAEERHYDLLDQVRGIRMPCKSGYVCEIRNIILRRF